MQQKGTADKNNQISTADFLFISDTTIRLKITDAIETISGLYFVEQDKKYTVELSKEIRRIIILYVASVIEAVMLYVYRKYNFSLTKLNYSEVVILPDNFQFQTGSRVVIAKQIVETKNERELMLDVLVKLFLEKKIISKKLAKKIKKTKDIRNTFHLSKSRTGILVSRVIVESSVEALYEMITTAKKYIENVK